MKLRSAVVAVCVAATTIAVPSTALADTNVTVGEDTNLPGLNPEDAFTGPAELLPAPTTQSGSSDSGSSSGFLGDLFRAIGLTIGGSDPRSIAIQITQVAMLLTQAVLFLGALAKKQARGA